MKQIMFLLTVLFLVGLVSAEVSSLGNFKMAECVEVLQTCANCSYVNITSITHPDSTVSLTDTVMTKSGFRYNYTYCDTNEIGQFTVAGVGDVDGIDTVFAYSFGVTPSGFTGTLGFYFLILILSLGIMVLGFFLKDAPIVILGSLGLYFIGLYILFNGIDGIRDPVYTWALGLIVLGVAFYISSKATFELIEG